MKNEKLRSSAGPSTTKDLTHSEQQFARAMQTLEFGRFESISIENGELRIHPWPRSVRDVKFGVGPPADRPIAYELKRQVSEFFEYARKISAGEIRRLEVRHGLPFLMEIEISGSELEDA